MEEARLIRLICAVTLLDGVRGSACLILEMEPHLDPREEDDNSGQVVKVHLEASEWLEVWVCAVVLQQEVESATDDRCSADVHDDGWNAEL